MKRESKVEEKTNVDVALVFLKEMSDELVREVIKILEEKRYIREVAVGG